jgi:hypothetical protein
MDAETIKHLVEQAALETHEQVQSVFRARSRMKQTASEAKREMTYLIDQVSQHVDIQTPGGRLILMKVIGRAMQKRSSDMPESTLGGDSW